jgi:hypothetical protein
MPSSSPHEMIWSTTRRDGVEISHRVKSSLIVALTVNGFLQTPTGRAWSPESRRYGVVSADGQQIGSKLPDGGKGLVKMSWSIPVAGLRVFEYTVLAQPDVVMSMAKGQEHVNAPMSWRAGAYVCSFGGPNIYLQPQTITEEMAFDSGCALKNPKFENVQSARNGPRIRCVT